MEDDATDSALLHAVLEAAVDAMVVSDADGNIIRTNPAACTMFGYRNDELAGQNVNILMPQQMAQQHDSFMHHHIETGENRIIGVGRDTEGQKKDGTVFPLHLSVGEVKLPERHLFVAILHDLTERTATQNSLARSQRLDAIGQMTGGIAHDFNNLLTVIIGNLELLQNRGVNERQLALIKDALESAELGADLTSRLMVFARKSNLQPVQADIREICEETLGILRRTLGKGYKIKTDFEGEVAPVMIDPVQLKSTLVNLALNARDAMGDSGELLISIANVSIEDSYMSEETGIVPGEYVRLSVSDDGAGMTQETQQRVFEPFFTTRSDNGGTGLGLAMVYGFVRQSGGHITLYSEIGLGTSFGLYFPACETPDAATDGEFHTQDSNQQPVGAGQSVLIVEDNPKVRRLSCARVRDLGYVAHEASNGDEAYRMLGDGLSVDLVFTDLVMPGKLNGYDLAAKVLEEFPSVKLLLTSGYASDVITKAIGNTHEFDILHKPFRQSDLAYKLHALLADSMQG